MKIIGIILIVLGVIGLAMGGFSYTTREKVVDLGPIHATRDSTHNVPLPPIAGGLALIGVTSLTSLDVSGHDLDGVGDVLGAALAAMPLLTELAIGGDPVVRDCGMYDADTVPVLRGLAHAHRLTRLAFTCNKHTGWDDESTFSLLAAAIAGMPDLRDLNLTYNGLSEGGMVALADACDETPTFPRLHTLDVYFSCIQGPGGAAFARFLARQPELRVLDIGMNGIGEAAAHAIAESLRGCTQLTVLRAERFGFFSGSQYDPGRGFVPNQDALADSGVQAIVNAAATLPALHEFRISEGVRAVGPRDIAAPHILETLLPRANLRQIEAPVRMDEVSALGRAMGAGLCHPELEVVSRLWESSAYHFRCTFASPLMGHGAAGPTSDWRALLKSKCLEGVTTALAAQGHETSANLPAMMTVHFRFAWEWLAAHAWLRRGVCVVASSSGVETEAGVW